MVTGGSFKPAARGTWPGPEVLGQSLPPAGFVSFLSSGGEEDSALLQSKGKMKAKLPLQSRRTLQSCKLKDKPWVWEVLGLPGSHGAHKGTAENAPHAQNTLFS